MPIERSVHAFKNERLNCAQSILKGFQEQKAITEHMITQASGLGGGHAQDGRCGALHAALTLVDDTHTSEAMSQAFVQKTGSEQCREIRKKRVMPCDKCVELAATLLDSMTDA